MNIHEEGFSLLELTVTVALMCALAGVSIPALMDAKNQIEQQVEELKQLENNTSVYVG